MEKIGYIYKITSPSGKSYIGQTIHFEKRIRQHSLSKGSTKLSSSIKSHGWEAHTVDILWEGKCTQEQLDTLEVEFINLYGTYHNGLNLTEGGGGSRGRILSDETKARMSAAHKGKKLHPLSEEHKAKISASSKDRKKPPRADEHRAKISAAKKGKPQSEDFRAKMSAFRKGKPSPNKGKSLSEEAKARMRGRTLSQETIAKRSATRKLRREGKSLNKP